MKSNVSLIRRLGAVFYDIFLSFSLVFFVTGVVIIIFMDDDTTVNSALFYIVTLPVSYLYFALSWVKGRQTLGMKAWKFQLIQHTGENITHKQALIRFFAGMISFATFGLGFVYQLFNKDRLSWHDKISKTLLIKN